MLVRGSVRVVNPVIITPTKNSATPDGYLVECLEHEWFHVHSWTGPGFAEQEAARHRATYHKEES